MKKYIEKLKDLKSTNKKLYISIICMLLLVGVTFAYVAAQITGGVFKNLNLFADTTDQLLFDVDKDLSLTATQFNFAEGGSNLSDTSIATARLKANSTNKTANYNYNVYLVIEENEFKYTTADKKTEILLQVTDPNGNALTTLDGLTYNNTLNGFDITEEQGILAVAENFAIASNSSTNWTTQNWTFTVTFINLDTNQKENAGKHMSGKIKIQQLTEKGNDITVAVNNLPAAYGPLATLNCKGSDSVYNQQYNRIEVSNISKNQSFCNVTYNDRTEKQYLNNYLLNLSNNELSNDIKEITDIAYDFEDSLILSENGYVNVNTTYSQYNYYGEEDIAINNTFEYKDNKWISKVQNMELNKHNKIIFNVFEDGYYRMCYKVTNGDYFSFNIRIENNTVLDKFISQTEEECIEIGKINNGENIVISQYIAEGASNSAIEFFMEKAQSNFNINTGYRFIGSNPNNYIWFNDELWRIVGVFNDNYSNEYFVKIVKSDNIGNHSWDEKYIANWEKSSLNNLLNNFYLMKKNAINDVECSKYEASCDYRINGIKSIFFSMIQDYDWSVGQIPNVMISNGNLFNYETGIKLQNKIGLISLSDFIYAVPQEFCKKGSPTHSCARNLKDQNWLYSGYYEWLLTSFDTDRDAVYVYDNGAVINTGYANTFVNKNYFIRPSLYLNSEVYMVKGNGSINNPYIIGM